MNNNNNRRNNFRRNDRNFKSNGDRPKFGANFSNNENFQRKAPGRNNHNASKLIEKYTDLAREALAHEDKILSETNLVVSIEASETNYWKKYTGINGLNFGINTFGKSAPYKEIYNHFNLNPESIIERIKKKLWK